jgi:4-amino-4-deoxy-L-arabinose transferase-like glycosyltransferase
MASSDFQIDKEARKAHGAAVGSHRSAVGFLSVLVESSLARLIFLFLCGLFIYALWLGDSPLDRTEPFRALVAHQMVHGGSWLVPHLYGEVYLRKPPLIYGIQASVELLLGRGNEFVWRLPSAVGSALLASFVGWWSGRWFGRSAILPAGFACLSLVALWDQNRGADIDALNTVFSVVAALCVLELLLGTGRWIAGWTLALGLSLGAALLLKGPGCLPQVIAAVITPAMFLRHLKLLRRRWIPLTIGGLIGFALFAAYVIEAKLQLNRLHIPPDPTGWYEIIDKIFLQGWQRRFASLETPFVLIAYGFPATLAVPFVWLMIRRLPGDDPQRNRAVALLGTLLLTLAIWVLGDNDNPRYEYVALPLLAPLVGWVWADKASRRAGVKAVGLIVAIAFCAAVVVLSIKLSRNHDRATLLNALAGYAIAMTLVQIITHFLHRPRRDGLGKTIILLILVFAVPMAVRKNAERRKKSAANVSAEIRSVIGNATRVSAAGLVRDLPELFYYANVDVDNYGEFGLPQLAAAGGGHWVILSQTDQYPAYATIVKFIPGAFPNGAHKLHMPDARDVIYVGWYDPPAGASTHLEWHVNQKTDAED